MENLRYVLYGYNPEKKIHFSLTFRENQFPKYLGDKYGFVLSRGAVENIYKITILNKSRKLGIIAFITWSEYIEDFVTLDSDIANSPRIKGLLHDGLEFKSIDGSKMLCYESCFYHGFETVEVCTNNYISFHLCSPTQILVMEFMIYGLDPYGISFSHPLPKKITHEFVQDKLEEEMSNFSTLSVSFPRKPFTTIL